MPLLSRCCKGGFNGPHKSISPVAWMEGGEAREAREGTRLEREGIEEGEQEMPGMRREVMEMYERGKY